MPVAYLLPAATTTRPRGSRPAGSFPTPERFPAPLSWPIPAPGTPDTPPPMEQARSVPPPPLSEAAVRRPGPRALAVPDPLCPDHRLDRQRFAPDGVPCPAPAP